MIRLEELAEKGSPTFPITPLDADSVFSRAGEDLTLRAYQEKRQKVFGREEEVEALITILTRRFRPNPILLGDPGVGKTVLVYHLAWRIVNGQVPKVLQNFKVCRTSFPELWATVGSRGSQDGWQEYQRLLKSLVDECTNNPIICFIDEIHHVWLYPLSRNFLKGPIAEGRMRVIGATTGAEYQRYFATDKAFERRFQTLVLEQPRGQRLAEIVAGVAQEVGEDYEVTVGSDVQKAIIRLSDAYLFNRSQPDRALDLLDAACQTARLEADELGRYGPVAVSIAHVKNALTRLTGIEASYLDEARTRLEGLAQRLKQRVRGQDEAVERVAQRLLVTKMRLDLNPKRPDGVFLFAGPTGVGKTELARAIAEVMTGSEDHLLKLDMANYKEPFSVNLLLGQDFGLDPEAAPEPSLLTRFAREHPFGVLLLDEIEKAHPEVLHLFLSILDDGSFRDRQGNMVWFSFVTIIMTTNLGFHDSNVFIGFTSEREAEVNRERAQRQKVLDEINHTLPKELLGRIDEVIVFRPLTVEVLADLVRLRVDRMSSVVGEPITLTDNEVSEIVRRVQESGLGARALDRIIETVVGVPLALKKLRGEIGEAGMQ